MDLDRKDTSYKELKKNSYVPCDFCDKEFKNRYESIVHNASHIIIPLWIQSFHKCEICKTCTTSLEEYVDHKCTQHINITPLPEDEFDKKCNKTYTRKKNINEFNVKMKIEIKREIDDEFEIEVKNEIDEHVKNDESIRNRIKYEDDEFNNDGSKIINDLVNGCRVSLNACDPPWAFGGHNRRYDDVTVDVDKPQDEYPPSISCSSLMEPGIYSCRYCWNIYPNRFSLIKHQTSHMKIQPKCQFDLCLQCDKYITKDEDAMLRHKAKFHKNDRDRINDYTKICKRCHLRFRKYKRHVRNYHVNDCHKCGIEIDSAKQYSDHMKQQKYHSEHLIDIYKQNPAHSDQNVVHCQRNVDQTCEDGYRTKILRVCELCFSFLKNKTNLQYYFKGETSDKLGVRYPCDNCGRKNFVLNIVKRMHKVRHYNRDHKNKTNEDRLKSIQHRFKKLNLLNKFYFVV